MKIISKLLLLTLILNISVAFALSPSTLTNKIFSSLNEVVNEMPSMILNHLNEEGLSKNDILTAQNILKTIESIYEEMGLLVSHYHNHAHNLIVTNGALLGLIYNNKLDRKKPNYKKNVKLLFLGALLHDFHIREAGTLANVDETIRQLKFILGLPMNKSDTPIEQSFYDKIAPYKRSILSLFQEFFPKDLINETFAELETIIRKTDFGPDQSIIDEKYKKSFSQVKQIRQKDIDFIGNLVKKIGDLTGVHFQTTSEIAMQSIKSYEKELKMQNILIGNFSFFMVPFILNDSEMLNIISKLPIINRNNIFNVMKSFAEYATLNYSIVPDTIRNQIKSSFEQWIEIEHDLSLQLKISSHLINTAS